MVCSESHPKLMCKSVDRSHQHSKCLRFTCSSSSFVTIGMRFRTFRAALWVAKRILIGRLLKSVPSSSALAISASVFVSWKKVVLNISGVDWAQSPAAQ